MGRTVRFMETILRDGQQSQIATRMPIEDMLPVLEDLDSCGLYALEVWGGATFDSCLRYLNEDPWERLRTIRAHVKNAKLQMLLRGQNLLGYHNYADDVVEEFVKKSVENGIDVLRIFDALNDTRNLQASIRAAKEAGGEVQAAICYTTSDVHTVRYFTSLATEMERAGADSIAIKDMAGVLTPDVAYELVSEIKNATSLPVQVHTHGTAGIGQMTYLKAVEAGADIIDTCLSPLAEGTSQPCTESMAITLDGLGYDTGLDVDMLDAVAKHFAGVRDRFLKEGGLNPKVLEVEPKALLLQRGARRGTARPRRAGLPAARDAPLADGGIAGAHERALRRALQSGAEGNQGLRARYVRTPARDHLQRDPPEDHRRRRGDHLPSGRLAGAGAPRSTRGHRAVRQERRGRACLRALPRPGARLPRSPGRPLLRRPRPGGRGHHRRGVDVPKRDRCILGHKAAPSKRARSRFVLHSRRDVKTLGYFYIQFAKFACLFLQSRLCFSCKANFASIA